MKKFILPTLFLVFLEIAIAQSAQQGAANQPATTTAAPEVKVTTSSMDASKTASADITKVKGEYDDLFPLNNYFMKAVDVFSIDTKSVPSCKQTFTQLCGTAKFPLSSTFTTCLQNKYNQFKETASCENLGTALIANNYLVWLVRTTKPCDKYFDKCFTNLNPKTQKGFNTCLAEDSNVPPLCIKLVQDAVLNSYVLSEIYDRLKSSW